MEAYRKYFSAATLEQLIAEGPNWGVNVHTVGHHIHSAHKPYPDQSHPQPYVFDWEAGRRLQEFQLVYIARGQGIYQCDGGTEQPIGAGTLLLHFPGVWHRYKPLPDAGWEEFWVGFDGHYAGYLMQQNCFSPDHPVISIGFHAEFLSVFVRLIETVKHEGPAFQQIASCLVIQLLGLVYAAALIRQQRVRPRQEQIVEAIRHQILAAWDQDLDFGQLAQEHYVSYVWFRKAFKDLTGTAPGQYHLQVRLQKTAQLLKETDLTVSEIAYRAGFESEFYFSRIFKKKLGITPTGYRRGTRAAVPDSSQAETPAP